METLKQQPFVKSALAVALGCLLAYAVISTYRWAWYEGYTSTLWLGIGVASTIAAIIWIGRRFGRSITTFCRRRKGLLVGGFAVFAVLWYIAGIAIFSHR